MTKKQAQLFFPYSEGDDLDDLWEQRLFKHKEYFLTRTPVAKIWLSRLKKIRKERNAYMILSDAPVPEDELHFKPEEPIQFSEDFLKAFNDFHIQRNKHKGEVLRAENLMGLSKAIHHWLATEQHFAQYWFHPASEQSEIKVAMAKEADPMEFLKELKETKSTLQSASIDTLKENYNNLSENVKKEVKRLTLLAKI